jgi:pathogenesis-related protein 1
MMRQVLLGLLLFSSMQTFAQLVVPPVTGSKVTSQQAQAALDFHNQVRKDVKVPALEWSRELAAYAQLWANKLVSDGCKLEHRPSSGKWTRIYGENIYFGTAKGLTATDASKAWYGEIKDFNNEKLSRSNFAKIAHYTQMVWRSTTKVGIGQAVCPSGATIIVANYSPMGNYMGQMPY